MKKIFYLISVFSFMSFAFSVEQRVISTSGSLTEIVYALQMQKKLVAVDTSSLYPKEATAFPQVGYHRQLSLEGLISQLPDLVLTTEEAGPTHVIEQLQQKKINIVKVPAFHGPKALYEAIEKVSVSIGAEKAGAELQTKIKQKLAETEKFIQANKGKNRPKILLLMAGGRSLMAAGTDTAGDNIIKLAGGDNIVLGFTGYKPFSSEVLLAEDPDFILVASHQSKDLDITTHFESLKKTKAYKNKHIAVFDSLYLLGFGPRLPEVVAELGHLFYAKK